MIALGKKGIVVPVAAEQFRAGNQSRTAQAAVELNPNLKLFSLNEGYERFESLLGQTIAATPEMIHWQPSNLEALKSIQHCLNLSSLV